MTTKARLTQLSVTEAEALFDARATGDLSVPYMIPIPGENGYWCVSDELRLWRASQNTSEGAK
jgi:hypothetical protein